MGYDDLKDVFGAAPASFRMQVNEMIDHLEDNAMKKRYKFTSLLLAAALAAVMLAGAGFAAERLGLFDLFGRSEYPIVPLPGAEELVETNLGSAENKLAEYSVQEAVYDGKSLLMQLWLAPKDSQKNALYDLEFYDSVETLYEHRGNSIEAALNGKAPLFYAVSVQSGNEEGGSESWQSAPQEDGSLILWYSRSYSAPQGESIEVCVDVKTISDSDEAAMEEIRFTLERSEAERVVKLEAAETAADPAFAIMDAGITFTKIRGYVEINYLLSSAEPSPDLVLQLTDAEGVAFVSGGAGITGLYAQADGTRVHRWESEIQTLETLPESMWIEAWDIESNTCVHRIECRVVEG